jgi:hypothetical protein
MRRLYALTLGLGLLSASGYADVIDFTPYAGYTTVNMGSVNKNLEQLAGFNQFFELELGPTTHPSDSTTNVTNAWIVGGDLLSNRLTPCKNLSLGLRGEFLETNQGSNALNASILQEPLWQVQDQGTLSSFMLGGRYQLPGAEYGLKLSLGVFAGLGYGTVNQSFEINPALGDYRSNGLYSGEGFVGDADLRLDWTIPGVKWLHLDAQGGYRYASLGDLSSQGQSMSGSVGDILGALSPDASTNHAEDADFSGLTAEGGLSITF